MLSLCSGGFCNNDQSCGCCGWNQWSEWWLVDRFREWVSACASQDTTECKLTLTITITRFTSDSRPLLFLELERPVSGTGRTKETPSWCPFHLREMSYQCMKAAYCGALGWSCHSKVTSQCCNNCIRVTQESREWNRQLGCMFGGQKDIEDVCIPVMSFRSFNPHHLLRQCNHGSGPHCPGPDFIWTLQVRVLVKCSWFWLTHIQNVLKLSVLPTLRQLSLSIVCVRFLHSLVCLRQW